MLLPLVSPFIDIMFVAGIVNYFVNRHYHPLAASAASFEKLVVYFLGFLVIDFITSTLERQFNFSPSQLSYVMVYDSLAIAAGVIWLIPYLSKRFKPIESLCLFAFLLAISFLIFASHSNLLTCFL